ncbi:neurofilament heavy polypeptide-like [Phymastichus coffea]|uniref:neurofilament heavy polypeptide-like n=1 Tax=Phymastichus coffea TaxID=108790 RepID=UPI00273BDD46|nr:neurofilament heavy polypeptide-like [Phymastichus coffea]XP_058789838.1 neurofilament heavy polypeptide-like [Phymastichus coffea]XP_058789839.1 neurofilament heavy polypeptide-like [Phymastichus coffea]XP_058789840.1 neurofilament heavy polypeptide-like [Phymastichus coffea]XP_058789841.1 neurofilament heavy polypeptide-like [Phymastichus coffea]XP_058789842.1 neurofilament heavy polypeptide-like [Phymastichus coffea]
MSAPAIKSSMPGVGTPTASSGHTMLPMNMVAQKVVSSTDQTSSGMKPLQGTNLNYVTLQPPNLSTSQPLSLIQEHRAPPYQTQPFPNNIPADQQQQSQSQQQQSSQQQQPQIPSQSTQQQLHKEPEPVQDPAKLVQNGMEPAKDKQDGLTSTVPPATSVPSGVAVPSQLSITTVAVVPSAAPPASNVTPVSVASSVTNAVSTTPVTTAQPAAAVPSAIAAAPTVSPVKPTVEQPKVNSSMVDGPAQERPVGATSDVQKPKEEPKSEPQAATPVVQNKPEEKKSPANSGTKETPTPVSASPQKESQPPIQLKVEEPAVKTEILAQKTPTKVSPTKTSDSPKKAESEELKDAKTPVSTRPPAKRKSREQKEPKSENVETPGSCRSRRQRIQTAMYQSPLPEMSSIVKNLSKPSSRRGTGGADDKLIVFYKNEFLAVRNTEGSFYVCQAMQNIYKSSKRIRIRWLSQDKDNGEIYSPDFYDHTDFDCILTNLNLNKVEKNKYQLTKYELLRTENILKRAIDVEAGVLEKPAIIEDHPDGLDLSLYKDEAQLKKRKGKGKGGKSKAKRPRKKSSESEESEDDDTDEEDDDNDSSDESDSSDDQSSSTRRNQTKKRSGSKVAIAQVSAAPKGPSRAERALNRSKGVVAGPSTSASTSGIVPKKAESKKTSEPKKKPPPKALASTSGQSKGKARPVSVAAAPSPATPSTSGTLTTQETKLIGGRPKRTASTSSASTPSTSEEGPSRKKQRTRT